MSDLIESQFRHNTEVLLLNSPSKKERFELGTSRYEVCRFRGQRNKVS